MTGGMNVWSGRPTIWTGPPIVWTGLDRVDWTVWSGPSIICIARPTVCSGCRLFVVPIIPFAVAEGLFGVAVWPIAVAVQQFGVVVWPHEMAVWLFKAAVQFFWVAVGSFALQWLSDRSLTLMVKGTIDSITEWDTEADNDHDHDHDYNLEKWVDHIITMACLLSGADLCYISLGLHQTWKKVASCKNEILLKFVWQIA